MTGFTKLHSSIVHSTVWREPNHTRIVWITILALADRDGRVEASIPGLADAARVSVQECEDALETLMSPDRYSRTPDHEGRRIAPIDGGWRLLNYETYRRKMSAEERREKDRTRKQKKRKENNDVRTRPQLSAAVRTRPQCPHIAEAEAEAEAEAYEEHDQSAAQAPPAESSWLTHPEPSPEPSPKPPDPIGDLWRWYENECVQRKLARSARKLSTAKRRLVQGLIKHIRETLDTDVAGACASQRKHLEYRLAQCDRGEGARKYMHTDTPWRPTGRAGRTTWWDWWHTNVADAPEQAPRCAPGEIITTVAEAKAWQERHPGQPLPNRLRIKTGSDGTPYLWRPV